MSELPTHITASGGHHSKSPPSFESIAAISVLHKPFTSYTKPEKRLWCDGSQHPAHYSLARAEMVHGHVWRCEKVGRLPCT